MPTISYSTSPAQIISMQFEAANVTNVKGFERAQPNCTGGVGPTQYIMCTNQHIRSFDKTTGLPDGVLDVDAASFLGIGTADVRSIYDRWGKRFVIIGDFVDFNLPVGPTITMAFSDGPVITPSTVWTTYVFPAEVIIPPSFLPAGTGFPDSPQLSSDQNAVYISIDIFSILDGDFHGVSLVVMPQSIFKPAQPFQGYSVFVPLFGISPQFPVGLAFAPTANNFDPNPQFGYMITANIIPFSTEISNSFEMYRIINPGSSSPSLSPIITLTSPSFAFRQADIPHKGNLYGANGLLQNITLLDFGTPVIRNHQLFFSMSSPVDITGNANPSGDRTGLFWYQYDLTGDPSGQGNGNETATTVPVLIQSGLIYDSTSITNPLNYWNPAITVDANNNMAIIGNFAGAASYIQAFYTGRKVTDAPGTLRDITVLQTPANNQMYNYGTLCYTDSVCLRWGDYCSINPDPVNDTDMWATSQIVSFANAWGILTTKLIPAP